MLTLKFNPFAIATHNTVRWPRIVHHAMHVLLGIPVAFVAWRFALPMIWALAGAFILAMLDKCVWIDLADRRLVWTGYHEDDSLDWCADFGFTAIGATLPAWWVALPLYYVLQLVSDP